jgi:uncharacterized protein
MTNAPETIAERAALALAISQNVPSPCISVCRMDATRTWCEGCLRSIDEIKAWSSASDADKRRIWALIAERHHALTP